MTKNILPIRPLRDNLFIDIIDRNVTTKTLKGGHVLHLLSDDDIDQVHNSMHGKHPGIRPRWARVLGIGPEVQDKIGNDIKLGHLVLCDTLKWSRKCPLGRIGLEIIYFWKININDILLINDHEPRDNYIKDFTKKLVNMDICPGHI